MPDCDYCSESFDEEDAYVSHLADAHDPDELSTLDSRKVEQFTGGDGGLFGDVSVGPLVVVIVLGLSVGAVAGAYLFTNDAPDNPNIAGTVEKTPTGVGDRHYHGTITMTIDGERVDFSKAEYQLQSDYAHFEAGNGQKWHVHSRGVTIEYFLATLGFEISENKFVHDDTTVTDEGPGEVTVLVNGQEVDPQTYVLQPEDTVRIIIETEG